jgi:hypothetical protein
MNKMHDLRFAIGVFSMLIGGILFGYSFNSAKEWNLNKAIGWGYEDHSTFTRWCGIIFVIFGVAMIFLSFIKRSRRTSGR